MSTGDNEGSGVARNRDADRRDNRAVDRFGEPPPNTTRTDIERLEWTKERFMTWRKRQQEEN